MEEIDGPTTVIFLPSSVANSEKKRERRTLLDLLIGGGGGGGRGRLKGSSSGGGRERDRSITRDESMVGKGWTLGEVGWQVRTTVDLPHI